MAINGAHTATKAESHVIPLIVDILEDTRTLVRKEMALANEEVRGELSKLREAVAILGIAIGLGVSAVVLFGFSSVYLLHAANPFNFVNGVFPLWLCFAIVGAVAAFASSVGFMFSRRKLRNTNVVPQRFLANLEEDIQWAKHLKC